jgi:hypothetical protein
VPAGPEQHRDVGAGDLSGAGDAVALLPVFAVVGLVAPRGYVAATEEDADRGRDAVVEGRVAAFTGEFGPSRVAVSI